MKSPPISASRLIQAPARELYAILADYRERHPRILPRPPFVSLVVEQGGVGAGTVIRCEMRVLGRVQTFHAAITEPDPGRVLVETTDTGYITTFTVRPLADGQRAEVMISTEIARRGIVGALEVRLASRLLQPTYVRELEQLERVALARV